MRVYTYEGVPLVHISAFAEATSHDVTTIRRAALEKTPIVDGEGGRSKSRPLKYFRDRSTLWIPTAELTGYPFIKGSNVYHYDEKGERYLCEKCTFTPQMCESAQKAADLVVPIGDK